jgi:hypothetical protein
LDIQKTTVHREKSFSHKFGSDLVASKFDHKICGEYRKFISSGFRVDEVQENNNITQTNHPVKKLWLFKKVYHP